MPRVLPQDRHLVTDATELVSDYASGAASPDLVVEAHLTRISALDPWLRTFVELRADGASLDGRGIADLRRMIAWLDPGIQIWNRSVLDNLEYASDDSALSRIGAVMEAARLREVVKKLSDGLQTLLGEGGGLLSGGEEIGRAHV